MASGDQLLPVGAAPLADEKAKDPEKGMQALSVVGPPTDEQESVSQMDRIEACLPGSTRMKKWSTVVGVLALMLLVSALGWRSYASKTEGPCPEGLEEVGPSSGRRLVQKRRCVKKAPLRRKRDHAAARLDDQAKLEAEAEKFQLWLKDDYQDESWTPGECQRWVDTYRLDDNGVKRPDAITALEEYDAVVDEATMFQGLLEDRDVSWDLQKCNIWVHKHRRLDDDGVKRPAASTALEAYEVEEEAKIFQGLLQDQAEISWTTEECQRWVGMYRLDDNGGKYPDAPTALKEYKAQVEEEATEFKGLLKDRGVEMPFDECQHWVGTYRFSFEDGVKRPEALTALKHWEASEETCVISYPDRWTVKPRHSAWCKLDGDKVWFGTEAGLDKKPFTLSFEIEKDRFLIDAYSWSKSSVDERGRIQIEWTLVEHQNNLPDKVFWSCGAHMKPKLVEAFKVAKEEADIKKMSDKLDVDLAKKVNDSLQKNHNNNLLVKTMMLKAAQDAVVKTEDARQTFEAAEANARNEAAKKAVLDAKAAKAAANLGTKRSKAAKAVKVNQLRKNGTWAAKAAKAAKAKGGTKIKKVIAKGYGKRTEGY